MKTKTRSQKKTKPKAKTENKNITKLLQDINLGIQKELKKSQKKQLKKEKKKKTKKKGTPYLKRTSLQQLQLKKRNKRKAIQKRKQERNQKATVGYDYAEIGDKIYDIKTGEDLGVIIHYNKNYGTYNTDLNITINKNDEGVVWDIIEYYIYAIGLNQNAINTIPVDWNANESKILHGAIISARSEDDAREFIVNNGYFGNEDIEEYGEGSNSNASSSTSSSIWFNNEYTDCYPIGDSYSNNTMLFSLSYN